MKKEIVKIVKHEIKLERSVKIILGVFAIGVFLNVFSSPISNELFGIKDALAEIISGELYIYHGGSVTIKDF